MMYGYYNYYNTMMGGWGLLGFVFCFIVLIDLILAGVWLWQNISKK